MKDRKGVVALFSLDSFAGGMVINALLALWLFQRFGLSLSAAGAFFFSTGLLSAVSQLAAVPLARRIGLVAYDLALFISFRHIVPRSTE